MATNFYLRCSLIQFLDTSLTLPWVADFFGPSLGADSSLWGIGGPKKTAATHASAHRPPLRRYFAGNTGVGVTSPLRNALPMPQAMLRQCYGMRRHCTGIAPALRTECERIYSVSTVETEIYRGATVTGVTLCQG